MVYNLLFNIRDRLNCVGYVTFAISMISLNNINELILILHEYLTFFVFLHIIK